MRYTLLATMLSCRAPVVVNVPTSAGELEMLCYETERSFIGAADERSTYDLLHETDRVIRLQSTPDYDSLFITKTLDYTVALPDGLNAVQGCKDVYHRLYDQNKF